jgi:4-carboxymuconolactone decarboxylase
MEGATMANREAHDKGIEIRKAMWGQEGIDRLKNYEVVDEKFAELIVEYAFGSVWGRPDLDLKSRSMCTLAVLTALNRLPELVIHIKGALNLGITEKEILEIIIHVGIYAGLPVAVEGLKTAREVFKEIG